MKHYFSLPLAVFLSIVFSNTFGQKGLPAIGKIDKTDLTLTDCDFDKGAEALTLIDWGNTYYDRGTDGISLFKTIFERRTRVKILKEKGLSYANVTIPFYSHNKDEKIFKLHAYTYNIDEAGNIKVTEAGKSSIYTKKINNYYSELIIAFPEVKVGSVIEYKYTIERETMGQLRDWFFQGDIPVRYSEYQLTIPQIFRFTVQPSIIDSIDVKHEAISERISVKNGFVKTESVKSNYIMHHLPGIREEPFMGSAKDYMQRLEFQLSQIEIGDGNVVDYRVKWSNVISDLMKNDDFGQQLDKTVTGTETIVQEAKRLSDFSKRVNYIYDYVRKNMLWNEDDDIYTDKGITKAWQDKNGNSADINLLLTKMLRDAGIDAFPVLFSTRKHGLVNTFYPSLSSFNTVMVVVKMDKKDYILDATDKISPYTLTPERIVNTSGFVISPPDGRWIDAIEKVHKFKIVSATRGEIDETGLIIGHCQINCTGYARKQRYEYWTKGKEIFQQEYLTKKNSTIRVDSFQLNNIETDSLPLEQKVYFTNYLKNAGDYRYFTVNVFSGLEFNPFVAEERTADVDFGYHQEYILFGNYTIPHSYNFETLPENISMIMPDTSIIFNRFFSVEDNVLNVRLSVEFKRSFYPAANYLEFKEFYKKLFASLNEQIVIKKK